MTISIIGTRVVTVSPSTIRVNVSKAGLTVNRISTDAPLPVAPGGGTPGTGPDVSASDHVHQLPFSTVKTVLEAATSDIGFNARRLTNIADPSSAQDAATKGYVDANAGGGGGSAAIRSALASSAGVSSAYSDACYTNTGASGFVTATLPTSASIGSARWQARFVVTTAQRFMIEAQGLDSINYFGNPGASLESSNVGDVLDIEYVGGGAFVVTGAAGQGWVFP